MNLTIDQIPDQTWQLPSYETYELDQRQTRYCVCIPIINEGERIKTQLGTMANLQISRYADILILDGGSVDGSADLQFLKANKVRTLLVKTGSGRLSAQLRMGYAYALKQGYQGIVTIDGNNKDDPAAIPAFLAGLDQGFDLLQGSRFITGGQAINTPWIRLLAIRLLHAPLSDLGARFLYTDTTNGFRAYSSGFLLDPRVQPFRDVFQTYELLAYLTIRGPRLGFRTREVPVTRFYPKGEIPTKITHFRGNIQLFSILLKAVSGQYNP
jgi:dolichol-phosphate mannosyltransferase